MAAGSEAGKEAWAASPDRAAPARHRRPDALVLSAFFVPALLLLAATQF